MTRLHPVFVLLCFLLAGPSLAQLENGSTPAGSESPTDYAGLEQLWVSRGAHGPQDRPSSDDGMSIGDLVPYVDLVEAFFESARWRYTTPVLKPDDRLLYWKMISRLGIQRGSEAEVILTTAVEQYIAMTPDEEELREIRAGLLESVGGRDGEHPAEPVLLEYHALDHARRVKAASELGVLYRWLIDHLEASNYPERGIRGYIFGNVSVGIATDDPLEKFLARSRAFDAVAFGEGG